MEKTVGRWEMKREMSSESRMAELREKRMAPSRDTMRGPLKGRQKEVAMAQSMVERRESCGDN